ncbi:hypothetical protein B0H14DRAFT_2840312 [Mycena olivaceomarginata]|nr:hypothetical protein B0H14DRAFT_2840312 [Mycena olivaceomarginata]
MTSEDSLPQKYAYAWSADSELSLPDFLKKYKPSMVQNDTSNSKPWIWVQKGAPSREDTGAAEALEAGAALCACLSLHLRGLTDGIRTVEATSERVQAEATEKFKDIAIKHGCPSHPADKVDVIWASLASYLWLEGPLAATSAFRVKVATYLICIYIPDVYDKDAVTEVRITPLVMKVLLRNHGMNLSGVKSNMYTALGIDSKHPSGLQSTTWKTTAILSDSESKVRKCFLRKRRRTAKKAPKPDKPAGDAKAKAKPQLKKKQAEDDPFGSDDDEDEEEAQRKAEVKSKKAPPKAAKRAKDSDDEDSEEEERPKKKKAGKK